MSSRISDIVDPWRLAGAEKRLEGSIKLSELHGVIDALGECNESDVRYSLAFFSDPHRRPQIEGRVDCTLQLRCQRCLEPLIYPVNNRLNVTVIEVDAEAQRLGEETDPLLATEGRISLSRLIEEELLLALPQIPRHENDCAIDWNPDDVSDEIIGSQVVERESADNPFAVLSQLGSKKQSEN